MLLQNNFYVVLLLIYSTVYSQAEVQHGDSIPRVRYRRNLASTCTAFCPATSAATEFMNMLDVRVSTTRAKRPESILCEELDVCHCSMVEGCGWSKTWCKCVNGGRQIITCPKGCFDISCAQRRDRRSFIDDLIMLNSSEETLFSKAGQDEEDLSRWKRQNDQFFEMDDDEAPDTDYSHGGRRKARSTCQSYPSYCNYCHDPLPVDDKIEGIEIDTKASKPHIVFFLTDDMGWGDVGFTQNKVKNVKGYRLPPPSGTPTIDGLAHEGVILDRHYTGRNCGPARASLLSGRMPYQVAPDNPEIGKRWGLGGVPLGMTILPEVLQAAGYDTYLVGKWHAGGSTKAHLPVSRGFNHSLGILGGMSNYLDKIRTMAAQDYVDMWDGHGPATSSFKGVHNEYIYNQYALDIIGNHDVSRPLFFLYSFQSPHSPANAPEKYEDIFPKAEMYPGSERVLGMVGMCDDAIKNVTDLLKERNMYDDTLIIFASDNGGEASTLYHLTGTKEWAPYRNYPLRGLKKSVYEGAMRVPAFISGGVVPVSQRGTKLTGYFHMADWLATLSRFAGVKSFEDKRAEKHNLPKLESYDMYDFLMRGKSGEKSPRLEMLLQQFGPNGVMEMALVQGDYKLAIDTSCPSGCLYNIMKDPSEQQDLSKNSFGIKIGMLRAGLGVSSNYLQECHPKTSGTALLGAEQRAIEIMSQNRLATEDITCNEPVGWLGPWADT
eukprot:m.290869 g.290869  ORF g.290869 m.290869 type:complete len:717 (+) comp16380_c0_seq43:195-2345(+)